MEPDLCADDSRRPARRGVDCGGSCSTIQRRLLDVRYDQLRLHGREYTRYAEYCLNMVVSTRDQELRCAQREMAAEWLRLADVVRRPRQFKQMQMG